MNSKTSQGIGLLSLKRFLSLAIFLACAGICVYQVIVCVEKYYDIQPTGTTVGISKLSKMDRFPVFTLCERAPYYNETILEKCNISKFEYLYNGTWAGTCDDPAKVYEETTRQVDDFVASAALVHINGTWRNIAKYYTAIDRYDPRFPYEKGKCFTYHIPELYVRANINFIFFRVTTIADIFFHINGMFMTQEQHRSYQTISKNIEYWFDYNFEYMKLVKVDDKPCVSSLDYNRDQCTYNRTAEAMMKEVGCIPPFLGLKENICTDPVKGQKALEMYEQLDELICPFSCNILVTTETPPKGSYKNDGVGTAWIAFKQPVYTMKVTREFFLYSFMSMIAEIGGYIGMFLGISVLQLSSVIEIGIDSMKKKL